jgi:hypothetical protein
MGIRLEVQDATHTTCQGTNRGHVPRVEPEANARALPQDFVPIHRVCNTPVRGSRRLRRGEWQSTNSVE